MANERYPTQEQLLSEEDVNNRIIEENNFHNWQMSGTVTDAVDGSCVPGITHQPNQNSRSPVPPPRYQNGLGRRDTDAHLNYSGITQTVNRTSPNITLQNSSESNTLFVSIRRRLTPLETTTRNSQLSNEERASYFREKRDTYLQEYLYPVDPSLNARLNLCAELMNLDLDFDRKYVELELPRVLDANKEKSRFLHLPQGLGILEKYASNLIKENRPPYWRTVKFTSSLVQVHVGRLIGSRDILKQMGYTQDIIDGVTFPSNVTEPDVSRLKDLAADLFFARYEIDALLVNHHPFYEIVPPIPQEEVELPQLFSADFPLMRPQPFPSFTTASSAPLLQHPTVISPSIVSPLSTRRLPPAASPSNPTTSPSTPFAKSSSQAQGSYRSSVSPCFPPLPTRRQRDKEPMDPANGKGNGEKAVLIPKSEIKLQPQTQMESEEDSEYEDAEDGMSTGLPHTSSNNTDCRICGEQTATEFCNECKDTFCESCYVTYHRHPSRKHHVRRTLVTPLLNPATVVPTACTAVTMGVATQPSKITPSRDISGTKVTGDQPRVKKPPVPAPRQNITVKSPPLSQVTAKDSKPAESKAETTTTTSVTARLPHAVVQGQKAPHEAISRQPPTVSPRQKTVLSPTSPTHPLSPKLAVTTASLGLIAKPSSGQQSVPTTVAKNVLVPKRREIRRPPPFITHNITTMGQDEKDNEEIKTTKVPPPVRPKPKVRSPKMAKAADYQAVASPEEDRAILCHNCYCLNSSDAKTCVACKTTLTVKANQQPSVQTLAPQEELSGKPHPQHPDVGTFPLRNQMTPTDQGQLCPGPRPTVSGSGTRCEDVSRVLRPGYQTYPPPHIPPEQVQTALDPAKNWQCVFCTFVNPAIRRVCEVCCKTSNVPHLADEAHPRRDNRAQQLASETQVETQAPGHAAPHHNHQSLLTRNVPGSPPTTGAQNSTYPSLNTSFAGEAAQTFVPIPPPYVPSTQSQQTQASWFATLVGQTSNARPILSPIVDAPVEERIQREQEEIFVNGKCYVEWLKKGEIEGFNPEEVNIASVLGCEDPEGPIHWLQTAWYDLIHTVMTQLAVQENSQEIGNVSPEEVREALIECTGNVSQAVKKCIDVRKEKIKKLQESGVFAKTDCVTALDNTGNVEEALFTLEKMSLEPMLQRLLNSCLPDSTTEEQVVMVLTRELNTQTPEDQEVFNTVVSDQQQDMDRRIRAILAEKELQSWGRAKTAIALIDMNFSIDDSVDAATSCGDLRRALRFLQQECPLCYDQKPMTKMFTFLHCQDRVCQDCVKIFVTVTVKDKNIMNLVCPICSLPDNLDHDEAVALEYFNNLDIVLRGLVEDDIHDLFQRKIRDRTLMKEPNFRWCSHCSSGFINEQPGLKMMCPHCNHFTCFSCKRQWEEQHEGITCEEFLAWKEANDPEFQAAGLAAHLRKNGIECPNCKFRYDLAKGGCMHFKCGQCTHEFCSGCYNRFSHGTRCGQSENCAQKGLHAHHPRDCYFYLRDRQPEELQQLLRAHNVEYNTDQPEPQAAGVNDNELEEEPQGAAAAAAAAPATHCKVIEQKQTNNGMVDEECGGNVPGGYAGLCKLHYVEYLVVLVNDNLIDPAEIMSSEDLKIVLRRGELEPPKEEIGMTNDQYRMLLLNTVKQQLPLPKKPPRKRILGEENGLQPGEEHDEDHRNDVVDNFFLRGFNGEEEEIVFDEGDLSGGEYSGDDSDH